MNKLIEEYITLEVNTKEFIDKVIQDKDLLAELQSYMPNEKTINEDKWKNFPYALSLKTHNFDLIKMIKHRFSMGSNPSGKSGLYDFMKKVLTANGFNLNYSDFYKKRFFLLMDILPDYIGGEEAESYIDKYIDHLDTTLNETQKKKQIKDMIKKEFVCKKEKPKWVQEPEWPVSDAPLMFISQTQNGDCCKYLFEDTSAGIKKEVIQFS